MAVAHAWQRDIHVNEQDDLPIVLMHGIADSANSNGQQQLVTALKSQFPSKYVIALPVSDGLASMLREMDQQLDELVNIIRADKNLANGFDAVGFSQGGLLMRAFIERYNAPPVRRFISVCAPQEGVGSCPLSPIFQWLCPMWHSGDPYRTGIAFSGYWKDVDSKSKYILENTFLADLNNERPKRNETYRQHMISLERYVLIQALKDKTVVPSASSVHGYWAWTDSSPSAQSASPPQKHLLTLEQTEGFANDAIGLRTLLESGRLTRLAFDGEHVGFTPDFWSNCITPFLAQADAPVCSQDSPSAPPPRLPPPSMPPRPSAPVTLYSQSGAVIGNVLDSAAAWLAASTGFLAGAFGGVLVGILLGVLISRSLSAHFRRTRGEAQNGAHEGLLESAYQI